MARTKKNEVIVPDGQLWPDTPSGAPLRIEVFGATGEYQSGKTLLGLSIAPGVHPEGHQFAGQPRCLYLDFEKSGGTYGGTGCKRIDVPAVMMEHGGEYTPTAVFEWFLGLIDKMVAGQYDVLMVDPVTDLEGGLVEYVKANCTKFGLSPDQVRKAGGLLWGVVKDYWKQVLLKLSGRCQCFFFTSHMRQVWSGNTPTAKREPKGKDTLMELASLYLLLERKPDKEGRVPAAPSAIVLKERLADTLMDDQGNLQIIHLLPPRIPVASVSAIRNYIANPPNYDNLKEAERVIEEQPTEQEMERIRLARAEAERDTEVSRLESLRQRAELQALAQKQAREKPPASTDQTAQRQADQQAKAEAECKKLEATAIEAERQLAKSDAEGERLANSQPPEHRMAGTNATAEQAAEIKNLAIRLKIEPDQLKAILSKVGASKVSDLSRNHAALLIEKLQAKLQLESKN